MALAGLGGTFAPGEFLDALHLPNAGILPLLIQLIAALLYVVFALSFAKITFMGSRTVEAPPRSDPPSPP